jgi:hypothetical protein
LLPSSRTLLRSGGGCALVSFSNIVLSGAGNSPFSCGRLTPALSLKGWGNGMREALSSRLWEILYGDEPSPTGDHAPQAGEEVRSGL